ncbi:CrcB family protein [uncultured Demequina sp.]|uniref:fluoride efflux transporter FluC n=1 Tax=uncultured Demequina sp. TaxID=693499 RepID=UPI0025FC2D23|nr:CrcB family protein [uncultured Demequina sp.]
MRMPAAVAVFIGGCLGGAGRIAIDELIDAGAWVWDVILINTVGSFLLGLAAARVAERGARWWTPMLTTGALGGFTTFSSIAALHWHDDASVPVALAVMVATLAASVAAAALGWRLGAATLGLRAIPATDVIEEDEL